MQLQHIQKVNFGCYEIIKWVYSWFHIENVLWSKYNDRQPDHLNGLKMFWLLNYQATLVIVRAFIFNLITVQKKRNYINRICKITFLPGKFLLGIFPPVKLRQCFRILTVKSKLKYLIVSLTVKDKTHRQYFARQNSGHNNFCYRTTPVL